LGTDGGVLVSNFFHIFQYFSLSVTFPCISYVLDVQTRI